MLGIPPAIATDAEDVIWALQTADALWKRNERVDAIVWLRRAAQAAGETEDDDRAFELAKDAAELAEWIARNPPVFFESVSVIPDSPAAGFAVDDLLREEAAEVDVDELVDDSEPEPMPLVARRSSLPPAGRPAVRAAPMPSMSQTLPMPQAWPMPPAAPAPQAPRTPSEPKQPTASATYPSPMPPPPPMPRRSPMPPAPAARAQWSVPRGSPPPPAPTRVLTAAEAHAGMLDPWAEAEERAIEEELPTAKPPEIVSRAGTFDIDEVVTSAPPVSQSPLEARRPPGRVSPPPPPPVLAPPPPPPPHVPPAPAASPPVRLPAARGAVDRPDSPAGPPEPAVVPPVTGGVDLSEVEALSDLPDDARLAFGRAATVETLAREDEVSGFALALVLEGAVDLSATIVDAAAQRLEAGAVLRARGTIASIAPVRLVGASERSRVATWDDRAVTEAFRTCPWVEDELRVAGDRLQALVGITMGPLGERLDPALRADVASRLRLRILTDHEVFAERGTPIPGLVVVGAGELELLGEDGVPNGILVRTGEFMFPSEALRAAPAPWTVRAAKGGALILLAERGVAQELIVTCPPLLEIFAEM